MTSAVTVRYACLFVCSLLFLKTKNEAVKTEKKERKRWELLLSYSFFVSHVQFVELQLRANLKSLEGFGGITRVPKRRRCH